MWSLNILMRRNEIIYHAWVNFSNRGFSNKVNSPGLVGLFLQAGHVKPHVSERTTLFRLAELPGAPRLLTVTPAVYPHLVLNHDFSSARDCRWLNSHFLKSLCHGFPQKKFSQFGPAIWSSYSEHINERRALI